MMKDDTIETLVAKAQAGDREAFDELARRLRPRLAHQIAARMGDEVRRRLEPEDILQETFACAFSSIGKFTNRGEESFYRWLGSIAEHLIWNVSQRKAWGELRLVRDPTARGSSPSKHLRRDERFERLEKALGDLSEDHRTAVVLARIEGLSMQEIAERMHRSPDAVKKLVARALIKLRESFGDTDSLHLPDRRLGLERDR